MGLQRQKEDAEHREPRKREPRESRNKGNTTVLLGDNSSGASVITASFGEESPEAHKKSVNLL